MNSTVDFSTGSDKPQLLIPSTQCPQLFWTHNLSQTRLSSTSYVWDLVQLFLRHRAKTHTKNTSRSTIISISLGPCLLLSSAPAKLTTNAYSFAIVNKLHHTFLAVIILHQCNVFNCSSEKRLGTCNYRVKYDSVCSIIISKANNGSMLISNLRMQI